MNAVARELGKTYVTTIRQNSDRCLLLRLEEAAMLSADLASSIKPADQYLVHAQLSVDGAVLVTTDGPLRRVAIGAGLPCLSRDEFLATYFQIV